MSDAVRRRPSGRRVPRKRGKRHGPLLGASARKKVGIPIVRLAASERWRGRSGWASELVPIVRIRNAANADLDT